MTIRVNGLAAAAALVLCFASTNALADGLPKQGGADALAFERSLKGATVGERPQDLRASVDYTATTVGGVAWSRPFADCIGTSGLGPVLLHSQPFHVGTAGNHSISSIQADWDGYIFVYQNAFDPTQPNTNCIVGNDDGAGGIGTSDIESVALTPGITYFLVTTGFANGDQGGFTSTISGPGDVTLGVFVPNADLGLSQTLDPIGTPAVGSAVNINLSAQNNGPGGAVAVTVTTTLPAQLNFTGSTCGATLSGSSVTWNIGSLANAAGASCTLNTAIAGTGGFTVSSVIASDTTDPVPGNNSASGSLGGAPASNRPAVVPTLDRFGLLALVLAVLAVAGFGFSRRQS